MLVAPALAPAVVELRGGEQLLVAIAVRRQQPPQALDIDQVHTDAQLVLRW
jgi:hypothetical protein